MEGAATETTRQLLTTAPFYGPIIVGLALVVLRLWNVIEKDRAEFRAYVERKDKEMRDLHDARSVDREKLTEAATVLARVSEQQTHATNERNRQIEGLAGTLLVQAQGFKSMGDLFTSQIARMFDRLDDIGDKCSGIHDRISAIVPRPPPPGG